MTLIDTADIYGLGDTRGFGGAEEVLGEVLKASPDLRDKMVLATKGGIDAVRPYDSTYDYLMTAMDKSLARLKTDYVDLYQIHRPDITTPMTETARALNEMIKTGKTKHVGVSNFTVAQTRALQAHLDTKIITTQPEFSALHQDPYNRWNIGLVSGKQRHSFSLVPIGGRTPLLRNWRYYQNFRQFGQAL